MEFVNLSAEFVNLSAEFVNLSAEFVNLPTDKETVGRYEENLYFYHIVILNEVKNPIL